MIYNGFDLDENKRVIRCPRCQNEEFSDKTEFCRICGLSVFNKCEGEWDNFNNEQFQHNAPGNARFCEICGKPTFFLTEGLLKPWNKLD